MEGGILSLFPGALVASSDAAQPPRSCSLGHLARCGFLALCAYGGAGEPFRARLEICISQTCGCARCALGTAMRLYCRLWGCTACLAFATRVWSVDARCMAVDDVYWVCPDLRSLGLASVRCSSFVPPLGQFALTMALSCWPELTANSLQRNPSGCV